MTAASTMTNSTGDMAEAVTPAARLEATEQNVSHYRK
jgi:hypothetical protein